jgi:hypothetical protein
MCRHFDMFGTHENNPCFSTHSYAPLPPLSTTWIRLEGKWGQPSAVAQLRTLNRMGPWSGARYERDARGLRTVKQLSISVFDFPVTRSILQKWSALSKTTCRFKVGCTSWRRNLKFRHTDHADLVWCVTVCLCYSLPHHFNAAIQRHTHPRWRQRETSMSSLPCLGSWLRVQ